MRIKYHEEFEKSRMGPSGGEWEGCGDRGPKARWGGGEREASSTHTHTHTHTHTYGKKRYRAVYDYSAADEDEVSFQDGDTIVNVQQIDDGWMYGTVERTGDTGMLPANYVEAI
ncbi:LASP1 [Cervus elaphus hippelaphus]|uniref:LASP1 n=1 Tax=Cervus elaphus hippelaphus TaxID=46360 RepID=A0A212DB87_CEREH|nr:LASP1 [Cervus elaphus hippelaphus]